MYDSNWHCLSRVSLSLHRDRRELYLPIISLQSFNYKHADRKITDSRAGAARRPGARDVSPIDIISVTTLRLPLFSLPLYTARHDWHQSRVLAPSPQTSWSKIRAKVSPTCPFAKTFRSVHNKSQVLARASDEELEIAGEGAA